MTVQRQGMMSWIMVGPARDQKPLPKQAKLKARAKPEPSQHQPGVPMFRDPFMVFFSVFSGMTLDFKPGLTRQSTK